MSESGVAAGGVRAVDGGGQATARELIRRRSPEAVLVAEGVPGLPNHRCSICGEEWDPKVAHLCKSAPPAASDDLGQHYATALGGEVVGHQLADGTWRCTCGEVVGNAIALNHHRSTAHAASGPKEDDRG